MKKILLSLGAITAVLVGASMFAAFEAHVVNVTARIENALTVPIEPIQFGTVFPQEKLDKFLDMSLSGSFSEQNRVNVVDYMIRQKPKCGLPVPNTDPVQYSAYLPAQDDGQGNFVCPRIVKEVPDGTPIIEQYVALPLLCPYLSKHEQTGDGQDPTGAPLENDSVGINAFHGLPLPWTLATTISTQVTGQLNQLINDDADRWNIDLKVPCFGGACAQDWADFVHQNGGPTADPVLYMADSNFEHEIFGCDLWVEVTGVNTNLNLPE